MKRIGILCAVLVVLLATGCKQKSPSAAEPASSEKAPVVIEYMSFMSEETKDNASVNKESITKGLSLEGALALLGQPRPSETNSDYPLVYSWSLNDGELLYVVFETDDRAAFLDDLQNGVYILPGETAEYGEQGVRFLTENEQNVVRQWTLNHKAVSAYCTLNGQTTVLFGASQE